MIPEDDMRKTLPCKQTLRRYHKLLTNAPHSELIYDRMNKLLDEITARTVNSDVPPALVVVHRFDLYEEPGITLNKDALNLCCLLRQAIKDGHAQEVINALNYLLQLHSGKKPERKRTITQQPATLPVTNSVAPMPGFKMEDNSKKTYALFPLDNSLAQFGVFKDDMLLCNKGETRDGDIVLMNLDDELLLAHISISYATPERITIQPLLTDEKIMLHSKHLRDVLAVVAKITMSQMIVDDTYFALNLHSPMSRVTGVGMMRSL